jgi:SAM-dependent MidA family methyltransferase
MYSVLREELAGAGGAITMARYMDVVLYHPDLGYYLSAERRPGRSGDFLTSPEATPLFGITLGAQIAECWQRMGQPEDFAVREYGSGVGGLAYDILAGVADRYPDLFAVIRYHLAERNRHRQADALTAFRDVGLIDKVVDESDTALKPITGVILANEVADAFRAHRLIRSSESFTEAWVVERDGELAFESGPVSDDGQRAIEQLEAELLDIPDGVYDVSIAAPGWFGHAVDHLTSGYAIVIDYGYEAAELYSGHRLEGTLRAYREHTVSDDPFAHPGETDLTVHVDFTALRRAGERAGADFLRLTTQGAFLSGLGLGNRLVSLQSDPDTHVADYLTAQTVVLRLIDPGGLGRFRVLVMAKGVPSGPPLSGLTVSPPAF